MTFKVGYLTPREANIWGLRRRDRSQSDIGRELGVSRQAVHKAYHIIDGKAIETMKPGVMIINTSRGALIDTKALIAGLKSGKIGGAGLDVYEEEEGVFFEDFSAYEDVIQDDVLARLSTFNNVIITSHQAFLTKEALTNIANTTLQNIVEFKEGKRGADLTNSVVPTPG